MVVNNVEDAERKAFIEAASNGDLDSFKEIYERQEHNFEESKVSLEVVDSDMSSVVFFAAFSGHVNILRYLYSKGVPFYYGAPLLPLSRYTLEMIMVD